METVTPSGWVPSTFCGVFPDVTPSDGVELVEPSAGVEPDDPDTEDAFVPDEGAELFSEGEDELTPDGSGSDPLAEVEEPLPFPLPPLPP